MSQFVNECMKEIKHDLENRLLGQYGISLGEALHKNPQAVLEFQMLCMIDFLDTERGQKLLFEGLNSTTMIYRTIASQDRVYRYMGNKPLNPFDLVPAESIEYLEKDSEPCTNPGCQIQDRPMWCVDEYETPDRRIRELCNFCAANDNLTDFEKCKSDSPECKGCANRELVEIMSGESIMSREKGEMVFK